MSSSADSRPDEIAIVGMACRFPGANNPGMFWRNLAEGRSSVREVDAQRWDAAAHYSADPQADNRSTSRWGGFIDDIDRFDAAFFRISPKEAALMDPQQRIMLELAWSCIEDAGYAPSALRGTATAVYVGVCNHDYKERLEKAPGPIEGHMSTGTYTTLIPNRISYEFDLRGASLPVDTACSSSLVALHEAAHAVRRGDCTAALVGGISVLCSPTYFVAFSKLGMLSPDGLCRTFDEGANGYVRGDGAGMVMLKPLLAALADGDRILGLVRATGTNHGGKVSTLTSPSPYAQARLLVDTYQRAGVAPDTVSYIEAHGTGTPKGDPIEVLGLKRAFASLEKSFGVSVPPGACGIGSVKTNIGHLESASGMAGLIKTLLAMRHQALPGLLHFEKLNPHIELQGSPFRIVDSLQPWHGKPGRPLRAGVSSFGFGGVNAHAVIEAYPQAAQAAQACGPLPVLLSARTTERLQALAGTLADHLQSLDDDTEQLPAIAWTLSRREAMEERAVFIVESRLQLVQALRDLAAGRASDALCVRGALADGAEQLKAFQAGKQAAAETARWLQAQDPSSLATWWVRGLVVDWPHLFAGLPGGLPPRIELPTYPFMRKRHWLAEPAPAAAPATTSATDAADTVALWTLTEAWHPYTPPLQASPAPTLLLCHLAPATLHSLSAQRPDLHLVHLQPPADADDGTAWIDAYCQSAEAIKAGIKKQPDSIALLSDVDDGFGAFLFAALQSLQKELKLPVQWVSWDAGLGAAGLAPALACAGDVPATVAMRRLSGNGSGVACEQRQWDFTPLAAPLGRSRIRQGGVYWITGGLGGIGRKIAIHLVRLYGATVVLSGRSPYDPASSTDIDDPDLCGQVVYRRADCTDLADMQAACNAIVAEHGALHGVIHAAGVLQDRSYFFKSRRDIDAVMRPKIEGALVLDQATRHIELDCFMVFSSVTGEFGNPGQTDYAAANAFMALFARTRRARVAAGQRHGNTQVVHWPYWEEGGMRLDAALVRALEASMGIVPMGDDDGMRVFDSLTGHDALEVRVLPGRRRAIEAIVNQAAAPAPVSAPAAQTVAASVRRSESREAIQGQLAQLLSELTLVELADIQHGADFSDYGVDSILMQKLVQRVNAAYGTALKPLQFHQCRCIAELAALLHAAQAAAPLPAPRAAPAGRRDGEDIAIIGADIQLPGVDTLAAFWARFDQAPVQAKPYPRARWDALPPALRRGHRREDCLGHFFDDVAGFDHRLFKISVREAMLMDPQQRLLLHSVWRAIENTGYTRQDFARLRTSVLLSIGPVDYQEVARHDLHTDEFSASGLSRYIAVNRISNFFDLRGLSEPVDTACSSFIVGLDRAIDMLRKGAAEQAVVAGVQLNLSPERFRMLRERGLLSSDGHTRPFDGHASGFVRSEGVGCIVLKPLGQALADHDHVHAVVKGVGVWHGGRSLSVTTPNAAAHRGAMEQALDCAGVAIDEIDFVEAHGTAMRMGDASEAAAFAQTLQARGRSAARPCAVGASKPVLGHLEAASGVAALLKAVLALQHRRLPGIRGHARLNPDIDAAGLQLGAADVELRPGDAQGLPCAGVNSYGLGGVSAFAVLQGHHNPLPAETAEPGLFVLSARSALALRASLQRLQRFLAEPAGGRYTYAQLIDTHQNGREAMAHRLAIVADSLPQLRLRIDEALAGRPGDGLPGLRAVPTGTTPQPADLALWVQTGHWYQVAHAWLRGAAVPWPRRALQKHPFPGCAFDAERRFWIAEGPAPAPTRARRETSGTLPA